MIKDIHTVKYSCCYDWSKTETTYNKNNGYTSWSLFATIKNDANSDWANLW